MKVGILGMGMVGEAIAVSLANKGHEVLIGTRDPENEKTKSWLRKEGQGVKAGTFQAVASFGELLFCCLNGQHALAVVTKLDSKSVEGKIIIDLTNPLDFSKGMPPSILEGMGNTTSLGEQIQNALPEAKLIKTLNTVNYKVMVDARSVNSGDHNLFISGNDAGAKEDVKSFLSQNFNWRKENILDLGGVETSRAVEAIVPFWVLLYRAMNSPTFNFKIVH